MATKSKTPYRVIGTSPIRKDAYDKVTGKAIFGADVKVPGAIWGEILRSPHPHARIVSIDTSKASKLEGVLSVVTHADFPPIGPEPIDMASDFVNPVYARQNILAGPKAMYIGHAVAAVAAVDKLTAQRAVDLIEVDYELLPAVFNVSTASGEDAPVLIDDLTADHLGEEKRRTNVAWHFRYETGDPEAAFTDCSLTVEREFKSATIHQAYIEPHNATVDWDTSGRVHIWSSTQGNFGVRCQTAGMLGLDESQITVYPVEIGGGFGGKTTIYLPPIAALLSKKAGRPVRMVMDRKSVFEATGPAPGGEISVKIGVDAESKIIAATSSIKLEAGAFPGWVAETAAKSVFACYDIANYRFDGYDVLVNKAKSNAYRAPGVPQVTFAVESVIDEICEKMELDPIDFRILNSSKEGVRRIDGPRLPRIGVRETFEAAKATDHWNSLLGRNANGSLRGRGIASSFALFSGRASTVTLNLNPDGTVSLLEGSVDINGTRTAIAMQVAEILGVDVYDVHPSVGNTDITGFTEISHGSRTTYATGWAACKAAENLLDDMRGRAAELWDVDPAVINIDQGCFSSSEDPDTEVGFKEMAAQLMASGSFLSATGSVDPPSPAQGVSACHIVDVEVDPVTGKVDVLRYTAVQDIGTAIHRAQVEGQIQGAVAQGIGWALNEGYLFNDEGKMTNHSFQDYQIPTSADLPQIDAVIVEVPNPQHPFGVRGAGEVSIGPPTGAIANAIFSATGARMNELPMEPGRVLAALRQMSDSAN